MDGFFTGLSRRFGVFTKLMGVASLSAPLSATPVLAIAWSPQKAIYWANRTSTSTKTFDLVVIALTEAITLTGFFATAYALGRGVIQNGWNPNYTRKLLGAVLILLPFTIDFSGVMKQKILYDPVGIDEVITDHISRSTAVAIPFLAYLLSLFLLSERFRNHNPFLATAFAAIDRPEDRPDTLLLFITSYIASGSIFLFTSLYALSNAPEIVFVIYVSVAVGDLLAGVIGHRFGRHRYVTRGMLANKSFSRSLEGSLCVFATTVTAILLAPGAFEPLRLVLLILLLPLAMTLAEAWAPHTWDEPFMFLTGLMVGWSVLVMT